MERILQQSAAEENVDISSYCNSIGKLLNIKIVNKRYKYEYVSFFSNY